MRNIQINTKQLLYWLIVPAFCVSLQMAGFIFNSSQSPKKGKSAEAYSLAPQVLGAATSIRGDGLLIEKEPKKISDFSLESISAQSLLAFDLKTGQTLVEKNPDLKISIASLTKLLTALVVYEQTAMSDEALIEKADELAVNPALNLKTGDKVKISDLFSAMLIGSVNDAAQTLSRRVEKISKNKFADLMNQKAAALGMSESLFSNPFGFDSESNYSSASDLKKLITATQTLAAFTNLGKKPSYQFVSREGKKFFARATNKLVGKFADIEAIKTGYTENSRGAMASKLTVGAHKIVLLVLESQNREEDTLKLRNIILSSFRFE